MSTETTTAVPAAQTAPSAAQNEQAKPAPAAPPVDATDWKAIAEQAQKEAKANERAAQKNADALAAINKRIEDPTFITDLLQKRLGVPATEDPTKVMETLRAEKTTLAQSAAAQSRTIKALALKVALAEHAQDATDPADLALFLRSDDLEVDESGSLVKVDTLKERLAALRTSKGYLFSKATQDNLRGPPLPTAAPQVDKSPPAPPANKDATPVANTKGVFDTFNDWRAGLLRPPA